MFEAEGTLLRSGGREGGREGGRGGREGGRGWEGGREGGTERNEGRREGAANYVKFTKFRLTCIHMHIYSHWIYVY